MKRALVLLLSSCAGVPDLADSAGVVDVGSTRLFVRESGTGSPLLLIHGGPVLDHGYLHDALAPLGDSHRLISYDQRLSGRTPLDENAEPLRLDDLIGDIDALRVRAGVERISILAHSWGGLLGMLYAARHPERVDRLILVGPMAASPGARERENTAQQAALTDEQRAEVARVRALPEVRSRTPAGIELLLKASFRSEFHDAARADALRFHIADDYALRSQRFGAVGPDVFPKDFTPELANVAAPTLVIHGADEAGATIGGPEIAAAVPRARLEVVTDAGHFAFVERPVEFLRLVRGFLGERDS